MGNRKSPCCRIIIRASPKSHGLGRHFLQSLICPFFLCQTIAAALYMNILHEFVAVQNALEKWPWKHFVIHAKSEPVYIKKLKYFISSTNISMIVWLLWIIESIWEVAWVGLPILQICFFVTSCASIWKTRYTVKIHKLLLNWNSTSVLLLRPLRLNFSTIFCNFFSQTSDMLLLQMVDTFKISI